MARPRGITRVTAKKILAAASEGGSSRYVKPRGGMLESKLEKEMFMWGTTQANPPKNMSQRNANANGCLPISRRQCKLLVRGVVAMPIILTIRQSIQQCCCHGNAAITKDVLIKSRKDDFVSVTGQKSSIAAMKDVLNMPRKEEFVLVIVPRPKHAAIKDVPNFPRKEEFVSGMGQRSKLIVTKDARTM